jgi:hypothetical protein
MEKAFQTTAWRELSVEDLLKLCATNKEFLKICNSPETWSFLLQRDFNIPLKITKNRSLIYDQSKITNPKEQYQKLRQKTLDIIHSRDEELEHSYITYLIFYGLDFTPFVIVASDYYSMLRQLIKNYKNNILPNALRSIIDEFLDVYVTPYGDREVYLNDISYIKVMILQLEINELIRIEEPQLYIAD